AMLDDEAADDVVSENNHGEIGVTENKSFDDGIGGEDTRSDGVAIPWNFCIGAEGIGCSEENAGG
ncbi:hypothetical protein KI387_025233, partial [Taxus chinensis]